MTLKEFIKTERKALDIEISKKLGVFPYKTFNDNERRNWILNDEGLYRWARSEGVQI